MVYLNPNLCRLCNQEFKYIAQHLKTKHKVTDLAKYYRECILGQESKPVCRKCGTPTNFQSIAKGYYKTCRPSCDNPMIAQEVSIRPAKRRKRSIISRKAARKSRRKNRVVRANALNSLFKPASVFNGGRSYVPRVHSVTAFGEFLLRSKNERNFVCALLRKKEHIAKVEYERTFIKYFSTSQNKYRFYIPDFKIFWNNGLIDLVEVKPERDKLDPIVVDKKNEAIRYCHVHNMSYFMISPREYQRYIDARLSGKMFS